MARLTGSAGMAIVCRDGRASQHDCGRAVALQPRAVQDGAGAWQARRDGACRSTSWSGRSTICWLLDEPRMARGARRRSSEPRPATCSRRTPTPCARRTRASSRASASRRSAASRASTSPARRTSRSRSAPRATAAARCRARRARGSRRARAPSSSSTPASASRRSTGRPARRRATRPSEVLDLDDVLPGFAPTVEDLLA